MKEKLIGQSGELGEVRGGWAFGAQGMSQQGQLGVGPLGTDYVLRGGTGVNGELSITSGTTTLDLGSAQTFERNYSRISITGTGALAFSNPHANGTIITLKSQGPVVITSTATRAIDTRSLGATGGGGGASGGTGNRGQGGDGGNSAVALGVQGAGGNGVSTSNPGTKGNDGLGSFTAGGGFQGYGSASTKAGTPTNTLYPGYNSSIIGLRNLSLILVPGGGGGGSAGGEGNAGVAGGRGAGALLIECGTTLHITSTIDASGAAGSNGNTNTGGGGGGAGGVILIKYTSLVANSATLTVSGGAGGTGDGGTGNGGAGAAGYALVAQFIQFI